jgi:putative hydrolase of the HAD superfamily
MSMYWSRFPFAWRPERRCRFRRRGGAAFQVGLAVCMQKITQRQHLIFDADDTLWENNVYFEQAFEEFCIFLNHSSLAPDEVRAILDEIERESNKVHGYGALNFGRNLSQCYFRLAERAIEEHDLKRVSAFAHRILLQEVELMEGVAETLPFLAEKHELTMFTKGDPAEQNRKIDLSGLRPLFAHCEVVKEKNKSAYRELARTRGFDPDRTWMIGNSPKSDINPALDAGMRAVFVPHERTWTLEREEIRAADGRLAVVKRFSDLADLFV